MTAATIICVLLPLRIVSVTNQREHWGAKAKRTAKHRDTTRWALAVHRRPVDAPVTITLTRIAPRAMDGDNLQAGMKATRDGVADWLGVDDGHPSLTWQYAQRKGKKAHEYAAEVVVEWAA